MADRTGSSRAEADAGAPTAEMGVWLFVAHRRLEERAYDAAVAAGGADVSVAQARVLARIDPAGSRVTELAARARVTKQTAGHLVQGLEDSGYVVRVPDPADGRARLVLPTAKARHLFPIANAAVVEELAVWRAHLGETRMRSLYEALRLLQEVTDPWFAPR